jgi:hypothetical protein
MSGHSYAVEFSPSELASESATLNIVTNAPGIPVQVPITGTGIADKNCVPEQDFTARRICSERKITNVARFLGGFSFAAAKEWEVVGVTRFNVNYSHFLVPVRFVLASVAPLKGESK